MKENTKDITASEEQMSDEISSLTTPDFKLTLHIKTNNGTKMLREGIHLMYLKAGEISPYRFIEKRGVTDKFVASRPAMEDEVEECDNRYRYGFAASYDDWEKLIQDEMKFTIPDGWINELRELQRQFPQFKAKAQQRLDLVIENREETV